MTPGITIRFIAAWLGLILTGYCVRELMRNHWSLENRVKAIEEQLQKAKS